MATVKEKTIQPAPSSLKASVWEHFGFYCLEGKPDLDKENAICKVCRTKVKHYGNTTNMRAHMSHHHPEMKIKDGEKLETVTLPANQQTLFQCTKLPPNTARAKKITRSIAYFISKDLRPYSTIENEGFQHMLHTIEPRYTVPSCRLFAENAIPQLYQSTKERVSVTLKKATRVALTCDAWTSRAVESYVTFTAHYITDDWQLETRAHMNELFQDVSKEWHLPTSDLVIVTDNAANMTAAVQLGSFTHVKCFAHTINLAAQRALKLPRFGEFHRSHIASRVLQQKQKLLDLPPHKLKTDVSTRWNSAFNMMDRFLEQQPAICAALLSSEVRKGGTDICTLKEVDVTNAEEMAMALKPLKEATVIMSEDSTPTLSVIAPLHAQLLHDTETGFSGEMPIVREIKQTVHEDLSKRYCTVREKSMLHTASTLDPRFKALPFLSQDEQQDIYSKVIAEAAALKAETQKEHAKEPGAPDEGQDDQHSPVPKRRTTALLNLLGKTFTDSGAAPKSASTRAEEEMTLSEDPLIWWRNHETVFPLLAKLAKNYLCIPGTSLASESVFSTAGDIVTAQRSMLSSEHVDQLLFLQKNLEVEA
ncbi:Zinc finger BED domain-containing protein 1 [Merluccius polli]|uniref:Zinc finger BED domain-containing protein 1 n=1 Tax=Merluccius polli TaxID=89951 RepID=A0AA47M0M1_MERPO|nr:Zinc finger BED domain-containing protein 1 [Merluccius polli]